MGASFLFYQKCIILAVLFQFSQAQISINISVLTPWTGWTLHASPVASIYLAFNESVGTLLPSGTAYDVAYCDTMCDAVLGSACYRTNYQKLGGAVTVAIGDGCSNACKVLSVYAAADNVPIVSFDCNLQTLSDKTKNPTFSRAVSPYPSKMYALLTKVFNWDRVAVFIEDRALYTTMAPIVINDLENHGVKVYSYIWNTVWDGSDESGIKMQNLQTLQAAMKSAQQVARIWILLALNDCNLFIYFAKQYGYDNGEYLFIMFELGSALQGNLFGEDMVTTAMVEGFLSVQVKDYTQYLGDIWTQFANDIVKQCKSSIPDVGALNNSYCSVDNVDVYTAFTYEAALMWIYGANKTLAAGQSITNGRVVTQHIINSSFTDRFGTVSIDENGDFQHEWEITLVGAYTGGGRQRTELFVYNGASNSLLFTGYNNTGSYVWMGGRTRPPTGAPACGWDGSLCPPSRSWYIVLGVIAGVLIVLIIVFYIIQRKVEESRELKAIKLWNVPSEHLLAVADKARKSRASMISRGSARISGVSTAQGMTNVAIYQGRVVIRRAVDMVGVNIRDRRILQEIAHIRKVQHDNMVSFVGACTDMDNGCILWQFAPKGNVQDILLNDAINLNEDFKISLLLDIIEGVKYLHGSPIHSHGHLTSINCVVDNRWTCKITDYGLPTFSQRLSRLKTFYEEDQFQLLWSAPELLRLNPIDWPPCGTQAGDIYSLGIIMQEVHMRDLPFAQDELLPLEEMLGRIQEVDGVDGKPFRPMVPEDKCSPFWHKMMASCWVENAESRPNISFLREQIRRETKASEKKGGLADKMIKMLEQYTLHLEDIVADRTAELNAEKVKAEGLLFNILPRKIASLLMQGKVVSPEAFDLVTLSFSDIVGFQKIVFASNPFQIVKLLNHVYFEFDRVAEQYGVYKVETIGDSYVVASGLPDRNEFNHIVEIGAMAIHLISKSVSITVPHMPEKIIQTRIGLHSGAIVAGVIGMLRPRYCLFGDTMNTASRMLTSSMALRIHLSSDTAKIMQDKFPDFELESRGERQVKGRGLMTTYWLKGRKEFPFKMPDLSLAAPEADHDFK